MGVTSVLSAQNLPISLISNIAQIRPIAWLPTKLWEPDVGKHPSP